jgi:hypothetical protein
MPSGQIIICMIAMTNGHNHGEESSLCGRGYLSYNTIIFIRIYHVTSTNVCKNASVTNIALTFVNNLISLDMVKYELIDFVFIRDSLAHVIKML